MIGILKSEHAWAILLDNGLVEKSETSTSTATTFVILAAARILSTFTSDRAAPPILPSFTSSSAEFQAEYSGLASTFAHVSFFSPASPRDAPRFASRVLDYHRESSPVREHA